MPRVDPPTAAELRAIVRHVATLPAIEGASVTDDEELGVTFVRGPGQGPDVTYAAMPRWSVASWPAALEAVRARLRAEGAWPSLLVSDVIDRPHGLADELGRRGWMRVGTEHVMWVGHASIVPHLDPRLRIEAVQPRAVGLHEQLERQIFGIPADHAERRRAGIARGLEEGRLRAWVVWLADEPVAVARLTRGEGVAGLHGIGVIEARRGQGLGTLITTIATRAGLALGDRVVWLSVHEDNAAAARVYTRLGFRHLFSWSRWLDSADSRSR